MNGDIFIEELIKLGARRSKIVLKFAGGSQVFKNLPGNCESR